MSPGESAPDHDAAIAGLGRIVEAHGRRLDDLVVLHDEVANLTLALRDLTRSAQSGPRPNRPTTWLGWHGQRQEPVDPAAAEMLLRRLTSWLNSVFLRYADAADVLPDCWPWHPDAVEELLCLWQAWITAFAATSPSGASDWHDRLRPGVVRRLRAGLATCSLDSHRSDAQQRPCVRTGVTPDQLTLIAGWWTGDPHRQAPSPPAGSAGVR